MRVGSVLYNRNTGELVSVIPPDTLQPRTDVPSRWLSIDPLAHKFAAWSPYNFVMNNPVVMIDPDGRDAIIIITPGANGQRPTVTVLLIFHATNTNQEAENKFLANSNRHWKKQGLTYTSSTGEIYDVKYKTQVLHDNDPKTKNPYIQSAAPLGENTITFEDNKSVKSTQYGEGHLTYNMKHDANSNNTSSPHELIHGMGVMHNIDSYIIPEDDAEGRKKGDEMITMSAGSANKNRMVIPVDVQRTVGPSVNAFEDSKTKEKTIYTLKTQRMSRDNTTGKLNSTGNIITNKKDAKQTTSYTPEGN